MLPKLSLEEFYKIKEKIQNKMREIEEVFASDNMEKLSPEEIKALEEKFLHEYIELQNELFQYDLSEIPFEAWKDLSIFALEELNLSQCHPNLDFEIVDLRSEVPINLKGCKLRNLHHFYSPIDETLIDQEVKDEYPNMFLSDIFPSTFRAKFLSKNILIQDLKELTAEQIAELTEKNFTGAISVNNSVHESGIRSMLEYVPLEKIIFLLKEDEELLYDLAVLAKYANSYYAIYDDNEIVKLLLEEDDIEVIRQKAHELFDRLSLMSDPVYHRFNPEEYSTSFKNEHPDSFPQVEKYPPEIQQKIKERNLTIADLLEHGHSLGNLRVAPFMRESDYFVNNLIRLLGEHFLLIVNEFPSVFQNLSTIFESYESKETFERNYKQHIEKANSEGPEAVKKLFITSIAKHYFGKNNEFELSPNATPDIYEETRYPDWMKESGYYVSKVKYVRDIYSTMIDQISSKTEIEDTDLKVLFDTLGYDNIKRLEKRNYFFSPKVVQIVSAIITDKQIEPINTYEEFKDVLIQIIFQSKGYHKSELLSALQYIKHDFVENPEEIILPKDAPKDLQDWYSRGDYNLIDVLSHDDWLPYIYKLKLKTIGAKLSIEIYNSTDSPAIRGDANLVDVFLTKNTQQDLLDFIIKYRDYFKSNRKPLIDVKDLSKEGLEKAFINYLVKEIKNPRNKTQISENSPDNFKNEYPELFLSEDAPDTLKKNFYNRSLNLNMIRSNPDWIPYLAHIHPGLIQRVLPEIYIPITNSATELIGQLYIRKYGLQAYLEYMIKYPELPYNFTFVIQEGLEDDSKETLESLIQSAYYTAITTNRIINFQDCPQEFKNIYPELFLPEGAPAKLAEQFYSRQLKFADIRNNPEFIQYLTEVDLRCAFNDRLLLQLDDIYSLASYTIPKVLNYITKEQLLELLALYGEYFTNLRLTPEMFEVDSMEELKTQLEATIIEELKSSRGLGYVNYQEDAPDFIKKALPEYFLDPSAPQDLKDHYYHRSDNYQLTFEVLGQHKEWHPYLKGKSIVAALKKINNLALRRANIEFLGRFGPDVALRLAASRNETVSKMIRLEKVELMYQWWLKTGKKFVPDYTVMQLMSLDDADKFLSHGKEWSSLMRNKRYSSTREGKEALIKLAYAFGIFDGDPQGMKKLDTILNDIPKKINEDDMNILLYAESIINNPDSKDMKSGLEEYQLLRETLASEGLEITSRSIFSELYRQNEDNTYTLTINTQEFPKSRELLRSFMEKNNLSTVISAAKAHTLFGAFNLTYDKDFREFLLKHLETFITNPDYVKYISSIQKQFRIIKITNSNRVLTPELAISFVQENKYENVDIGNESLTRVSAAAGYTQQEFDTLQQIFNIGKTRVTSSIPRIEGELGQYRYELLRLTDPLAIGIGTLSDCCQEIDNAAEVCMEHSMVSKHGRVFVIRDAEGNIEAQSWVWRNKDVLCFDNIEIPEKAFNRNGRNQSRETRRAFTEEIYQVYKRAARELIELDEKIYKELLDSGKITQEQYDGLRLGKITVGTGYNDIAEALTQNAPLDDEIVSRPLAFTPPVELSRELYTSDSRTQRVLEKREDRKSYDGETPTVHFDDFEIYDITNIDMNIVTSVNRLEISTGRHSYYVNTSIDKNDVPAEDASTYIMTQISDNYGTQPELTKIIVNPNFAIIFEEKDSEIRIVDVFTALNALDSKQKLQMKLAILQLMKSGKTLNFDALDSKELEILNSIVSIPETDLEEERGISHGI